MKIFKFLLISALLIALSSCAEKPQALVSVNLAPVPYYLEVPEEIAKHLIIENMSLGEPSEFTKLARESGAIAQVYVNYRSTDGTIHGYAGIYYFKKIEFAKAQNPNEPPVFGSIVVEDNLFVLAVAGPQESIFDTGTDDFTNSNLLHSIIYDSKSYILAD